MSFLGWFDPSRRRIRFEKSFSDQTQALATVYLGPRSRLDASGVFVPSNDRFGRLTGSVLSGGEIIVSGNIVGSAGAVIDVSGASFSS
jgi:hypothetical protein